MSDYGEPLTLKQLLTVDLMRTIYSDEYVGQTRARPAAIVATWLSPEFTAVLLYRLAGRLIQSPFRPFGWLLHLFNRYLTNTDIAPFAVIGPGFRITHTSGVVIGAGVVAGRNLTVYNSTNLGARKRGGMRTQEDGMPRLGDGVFIGAGARVLGPVNLGDGVVVGANAVLVTDVPPHTTVVGIPARPVSRADDTT